MTLFAIIQNAQKKWEEARARIDSDPECIYVTRGHRNNRLVIHELCRLVTFPRGDPDRAGELSDDEEDEVSDQRPVVDCLDCLENDNQRICELASHMIEMSHNMGPTKVSFPNESTDESHSHQPEEDEERQFEVHESILTVTDSLNKTPLHVLCEQSVETELLQIILKSTKDHNHNPSAPTSMGLITARDSRGSTPLHYLAFSRQCPIGSLRLMMDYSKPISNGVETIDPTLCRDDDGDTPLHWALEGYMSARRVNELLKHSKAALSAKNTAGKVPFELFVTNFIDSEWKEHEITGKEAWESIQGYLKVIDNHNDLEGDEQQEWLPLHMLANSSFIFPEVFYDIAMHYGKDDMSKLDYNGRLPLHLACARSSRCETTCKEDASFAQKLVVEYPQAAYKAATKSKRLPIHFAVETRKPLKLIAALLKAYPNSLNVKDPRTGLWPFLLAASNNDETIDSSYSLLRADPSIVQLAISALISKRGQRAAEALRRMDASELEEHSHRRFRRSKMRERN